MSEKWQIRSVYKKVVKWEEWRDRARLQKKGKTKAAGKMVRLWEVERVAWGVWSTQAGTVSREWGQVQGCGGELGWTRWGIFPSLPIKIYDQCQGCLSLTSSPYAMETSWDKNIWAQRTWPFAGRWARLLWEPYSEFLSQNRLFIIISQYKIKIKNGFVRYSISGLGSARLTYCIS